jgi:RNA polymerase sigma factor (sigma-70 family)
MMVRADRAPETTKPNDERTDDATVDPAGLNTLAQKALGKEAQAIRTFLQAIAPAIRRTCRGAMGPGHADLEDTIQEALVDTMRALPRYRFEGNVIHYVTKIALRLAIDARRRGTLRSGHLLEFREHQVRHTIGHVEDRRFEEAELARQVLQQLSPTLTEALVLHLILGFSIDEVASMTQTRTNTVRKRLRAGRASMRRKLAALGHVSLAPKGSER